MYMPTTLPGVSVTKAAEILQTQNKVIKTFPEVESVHGKAGRADRDRSCATEMFETSSTQTKPQWRPGLTVDG
jgi:Cu(I)/Ag(I) efflux system membrane protein CusA/SilA